jgi:predicted aspartyl protease
MKSACVIVFSMGLAASSALCGETVTGDRAEASVAIQRDGHGRLRAPVFINGRGPFSLIVDTGANGSAISAKVAEALGFTHEGSAEVLLRGVTGSSRVPAVTADSMALGEFTMTGAPLPIVADALDGADGFLGTGVFAGKRVLIDFQRGRIAISASRPWSDGKGFVQVPADLSRARLVAVDTRVNGVAVKAIIDTGAGGTVGNSAMRDLLAGTRAAAGSVDQIVGATAVIAVGRTYPLPPIELGALLFAGARVSFADVAIFSYFHLSEKPALLIGMDVLGQLDSMIIDYGAGTLRLRPPERRAAPPPRSDS